MSFFALLGAFIFDVWVKIPVCYLCLYQRGVHGALVVVLGWLIYRDRLPHKWILLLYLFGFFIACVQSGAERLWWVLDPSWCRSVFPDHGMTSEQLITFLHKPFRPSCGQLVLRFFGVSLADANALLMLGGMGLVIKTMRTKI